MSRPGERSLYEAGCHDGVADLGWAVGLSASFESSFITLFITLAIAYSFVRCVRDSTLLFAQLSRHLLALFLVGPEA